MFEDRSDSKQVEDVVLGHRRVQTVDAGWLCLENIYQKFNRPNLYNIGGTYIHDVNDYWFSYKTETFGNTFLLHIFVLNNQETKFNLGLSYSSQMVSEKNGIVYLPKSLKEYEFNITEKKLNYITTYNYTLLDIETLKNKKLYICVKFLCDGNVGFVSDMLSQVRVAHDLGALLADPICSDFTIESGDGHKFQVHKLILATQSDVFNAMLKEDTAESQNKYVKLVDVGKDDLYCILQFIYTGTVQDISNCNCSNLLMLADKYDLKNLYELAQYALCEQLSLTTALDILVIADMYNSSLLKKAALNFIKQNPSVLKSSLLKDFKNVTLMQEVCRFLVTDD